MTGVLTVLRMVCLRAARRRPRRTLLSVLGIACSVGLVLSLVVIHTTLSRTISHTSGLPAATGLVVTPVGTAPLRSDLARRIRAVPGSGTVIPIVRQISRIEGAGTSHRAVVLGLPRNGFRLLANALPAFERAGSSATLSGPLAAALHVTGRDGVSIGTPTGRSPLRVGRVLDRHTGTTFNGGMFVLLPLAGAQRLFDHAGAVDLIYVYPSPGISVATVERGLRDVVGRGATVERPRAQEAAFRRTFDAIASTSAVVELIGVLIGVFLVFNTVAMSVAERRKEIAVAGLAGATPGAIAGALVAEAALAGAVGGAVGTALGFGVAKAGIGAVQATYASVLPVTDVGAVSLSVLQVLLGVGVGAGMAIVGAAFAARRVFALPLAATLRPATAYATSGGAGPRGRSVRAAVVGVALIAGAGVLATGGPAQMQAQWMALLLLVSLIGIGLALPLLVRLAVALAQATLLRPFGIAGRLAGIGLVRAPARTTLTVAALAAALAVTIAAGTGTRSFEREAAHVVSAWNAAPLYLRAPGAGPLISDQPFRASLAQRVEGVPGVAAAYPERFALVGQRRRVAILAMPIVAAARRGDVLTRDVLPSDGATVRALAGGAVIVSRLLARHRGVGVGDLLTLPTARGEQRFPVAGLFNDINADDSLYMDLATFQRVMGDRDADRYAVFPAGDVPADRVAPRLQQLAAARHLNASVYTGSALTSLIVDTVQGLFSFANLALLVASLVAALTITNTMLTTTLERRRELAVHRMLGMRTSGIAWTVLLEGAALAAVAAAIGVVVGLLLAFIVIQWAEAQLAWHIAFHLDAGLLLAVTVLAPALGGLAAGYPSWLATRPGLTALLKEE